MSTDIDLIDQVLGIEAGTRLDQIRRSRPVARKQIQVAEQALFDTDGADISRDQRRLVGAFVTELTIPGSALAAHRRGQLGDDTVATLDALIASAPATGPHGTYREPGLAAESDPVETWQVPDDLRSDLGEALAAVLEHTHLLITHPRDSRPAVLARLVEAGWSRAQIVTWSQLVAFASFQTRIVHGLEQLQTHLTSAQEGTSHV